MNLSAAIANSLWLAANLPAARRFRRALSQPAAAQTRLLQNYLIQNRDTAFGKVHGFVGIKNYADFARRVPLNTYADLQPWIERVRRGEHRVLTSEPITHFIPTSGSSGARKLIPFTAGLQREFNAAICPWIADLYRRHPFVVLGTAYWSISPAVQIADAESSVVPTGFDDDSAYLGGARKRLVNSVMAAPSELRLVSEMEQFKYLTLLCLLRQSDLRLISVWHPSFLSLLLDSLPVSWEGLLQDIESGICQGSSSLPPAVFQSLNLHALPQRARQLRNANPARPETIWPHLKIISCWGDGHAGLAKAELERRFPSAFIQSKGLLATECVVTIPLADAFPLAVCSHFFEFMDDQGRIYLAHELKENEVYELIVTTSGGLWRYRLRDQVNVSGFVGKTPSLRFLGRAGSVSDRFGEKLSEHFVARVIHEVIGAQPSLKFAMLAPDEDNSGSFYTLFIEGDVQSGVMERLDTLLCENPNYDWSRKLGQLQSPRLFKIKAGGYETFAARELSQGKRLGDIKPCSLTKASGWSNHFSGGFVVGKAHQHIVITSQ